MKTFKCFLAVLCALLISTNTNAQEVHRILGIGLQSSFQIYGISLKYAFTESSMGQVTLAPFGIKAGGASTSINFYGARYIYRFIGNDEHSVVVDPFLYAGAGLIAIKTDFSSFGGNKRTQNVFSYSFGGGLELLLLKRVGVSFELGYGKISISSGTAVNSIVAGTGIHYYIF